MRRSDAMISGQWSLVIPGDTGSIAPAREFARSHLGDAIDPVRASDIALAVSELVTNAVEYGLGDEIEITIGCRDDVVELMVTSRSLGLPLPRSEPVGVDALRGRGLQIVASLSDHIAVSASGDVVTVRCSFDLSHPVSPS